MTISHFSTVLNNISSFYEINVFWQDQILIATNQLISEHKTYKYECIINLIEKTIQKESNIWELKNIKYPTSIQLKYIKNCAEFISNYAASIKIDNETYERLYCLAILIFENRKYVFDKLNPYEVGYVTRFLNSESGRISEAMFVLNNIYYSFNKTIDPTFITILNREISKEKKDEMFFFAIGAYLNYLYNQKKEWLDENLKYLISEPFFDGLFSYCHIYKELYEYLSEKKIFDYIIEHYSNNEWSKQMITYSCFNILHDGENLSDETCLLRKIINKISPNVIDNIVQFIRRNSKLKINQKTIKELWGYIYKSLQSIENLEPYKNVLQELLYLLDNIRVIDKNVYEYLKLSCNNLTQYSMDHYIIPKFSELYKTKHNRQYIENLFELITDNDIYFYDYKDCVTNFFMEISRNNIALARKLCDKYYYKSGFDKYSDLVKEFKRLENNQDNN